MTRIWRLLQGPGPVEYHLTRVVIVRGLALCFAIAFASLGWQIEGLIGADGIMPAEPWVRILSERIGPERYYQRPMIFWLIGASNAALHAVCVAGVGLSVAVMFGLLPGPGLLILWFLYLSLAVICRLFLGYQWDNLLLEAGLVGAFFAAWNLRDSPTKNAAPSPIALFLLRALLFKLIFMSGMVKILSEDSTWSTLTALRFHYWTTCLPAWPGMYALQLPLWAHKASVAGMFAVELALPFLFFGPRRARILACAGQIALQVGIAATGNYGFFNLLTVVLCLSLLDDRTFTRILPAFFAPGVAALRRRPPPRALLALQAPVLIFALLYLSLSGLSMYGRFVGYTQLSERQISVLQFFRPFRSVNGYGLFATMTTRRPEIIVEGSNDGETWKAYEFKWKVGDLKRRPGFMQPHMPRLDWQMWFAALGSSRRNTWFIAFLQRLQEGSAPVLDLIAHNPFPNAPPKQIRSTLWEYEPAHPRVVRARGEWWRRKERGPYARTLIRK